MRLYEARTGSRYGFPAGQGNSTLANLGGTLGGPPWGPPGKTSNVLLPEAGRTLIFRHSGRMKEEEMEAFFGTLGRLIGVDMGAEQQP